LDFKELAIKFWKVIRTGLFLNSAITLMNTAGRGIKCRIENGKLIPDFYSLFLSINTFQVSLFHF